MAVEPKSADERHIRKAAEVLRATVAQASGNARRSGGLAPQAPQVVPPSLGTASDRLREGVERFASAFGLTPSGSQELARRSTENLEAATLAGASWVRSMQAISGAWLDLAQGRIEKSADALGALAQARSLQELFALQTSLAQSELERTIEDCARLTQLSTSLAGEAAEALAPLPLKGRTRS